MNSRQERQSNSIEACLISLAGPAFNIPEITSNRRELALIAKRIEKLHFTQSSEHPSADAGRVRRLRTDLRVKYLLRISRRAEVLLDGLPGIREDFRVPHAKASNAELIEGARRIAKHYRTHSKSFLGAGFPKDLARKLDVHIAELEKWSSSNDTALNRRSRATASLPADLALARKIIKSIDATVRSELSHDPVAIHVWNRAKRVPGRIGRPKVRKKKDVQ